MSNATGHQEIIIIKRGGEEEPHATHGAWKIAYADFVTAMMAFFLVMWLINSSNEVTKSRVASYFNPIKMTDASPVKRGLREVTDSKSPLSNVKLDPAEAHNEKKAAAHGENTESGEVSDAEMMMKPFEILEQLVKKVQFGGQETEADIAMSQIGDPFDPRSFEAAKKLAIAIPTTPADKAAVVEEDVEADHDNRDLEVNSKISKQKVVQVSHEELAVEERLAATLRTEIEAKISKFGEDISMRARVEVTSEGLLIILEDGSRKSMFAVGSARPNSALIEIVGDIGKLIATSGRQVVVRGHTDGRQFQNRKYDNWQLSTDRAHMASYMLMRGGLAENRIRKIEGYGSSSPLEKDQPMLDANRRVEFLLAK